MACQIPTLQSRFVRGYPLIPQENEEGGKNIGNRTRPFAYTFRANENEKNLIDKAISASGLTMREFVIRAIINKPVIVIERGGEILLRLALRMFAESGVRMDVGNLHPQASA